MAAFAAELNVIDDRQVLDRTNLQGRFDFELHFDNNATAFLVNGWTTPVEHDPGGAWPPIYEAVTQQLGLKLKPTKAQLPILTVDHIDPPSDN